MTKKKVDGNIKELENQKKELFDFILKMINAFIRKTRQFDNLKYGMVSFEDVKSKVSKLNGHFHTLKSNLIKEPNRKLIEIPTHTYPIRHLIHLIDVILSLLHLLICC